VLRSVKGAIVFIDRNAPVDGHFVRPNIAAAGGLHNLPGAADADSTSNFFGIRDGAGRAQPGVRHAIATRGRAALEARISLMTLAHRSDIYGILRGPPDPCRRNQGSAPSVLHRAPVAHQARRSLPLR